MNVPANATEAPSTAKTWQQVKGNAPVFITVWALILITTFLDTSFTEWLYDLVFQELHYILSGNINEYSDITREFFIPWAAGFIAWIGSLPITAIPSSLALVLMTVVPAIYYATDRCPGPREIFSILSRKPLRYLLAGFLFNIIIIIGLLLCVVPGILVMLAHPFYVHYVFATNLDLGTCLSKAFKGMFQDFASFFVISLLCTLAIFGSILLCIVPVLVVLPMAELYMQNYIHYKGLVSAQEFV